MHKTAKFVPQKNRLLLRAISLFLVMAFGSQELAIAAPGQAGTPLESPLQMISQNPSLFEAPLEFVSMKEVHPGNNGSLIILIEDAHSNYSAQKNLANALDAIMTKYGVSLVLSEGGSEDCSLTALKKIAPPEVWKKIAKSYLLQGKIAGEEYLNLISDHPMKIMGLEDIPLYLKSVQNYANLADKRQLNLNYLKEIRGALGKLKNKLYPEELKQYEKLTAGSLQPAADQNFETRFKMLLELATKKNVDLSSFPNVMKLTELQLKEKLINFEAANLEQAALFDEISKKAPNEIPRLAALARDDSTKKLFLLSHFENTLNISKQNNINVKQYPNWLAYGDYLKDFAALDLDRTLEELTKAEDKTYAQLLLTEDERLVRAIDRYLGLLESAYRIQMTTKEFEMFRLNEPDFGTIPYLAFINRKLVEAGYFQDLIPYKNLFEEGKTYLETFYESVGQRDFAFMRNIEKIMGPPGLRVEG